MDPSGPVRISHEDTSRSLRISRSATVKRDLGFSIDRQPPGGTGLVWSGNDAATRGMEGLADVDDRTRRVCAASTDRKAPPCLSSPPWSAPRGPHPVPGPAPARDLLELPTPLLDPMPVHVAKSVQRERLHRERCGDGPGQERPVHSL